MKWRNIDAGAAYYFITGTFTQWLPLLNDPTARAIVCEEITRAVGECGATLTAYVLMPDHVHLLVYLPDVGLIHRFNKLWRGRSARRIIDYALERQSARVLDTMARHANGRARYAVWKEQTRDLAIWSERKLVAMVRYIHANPVRRGLVSDPGEWHYSSWRFYELGEPGLMAVTPPVF